MQRSLVATRVLALDLRPRRFGFAVLEGPRRLLEWGVKTCRTTGGNDMTINVQKQIVPLLALFEPSVIIVKHISIGHVRRHSAYETVLKAIAQEALEQGIELVFVGKEEIQHLFQKLGKVTNHEIASAITLLFPQLTWKLPPVRKPWQTERYNMAVFNAIAQGLSYLARFGDVLPTDSNQQQS